MAAKRYQLASKNCSIKLSTEKVCNTVVPLHLHFYNDNDCHNDNDDNDKNNNKNRNKNNNNNSDLVQLFAPYP